MDGVWSNLLPLYRAYTFAALTFPGKSLVYDYTRDEPRGMSEPGAIVAAISRHSSQCGSNPPPPAPTRSTTPPATSPGRTTSGKHTTTPCPPTPQPRTRY